MKNILNITNGDSAVAIMEQAGITGTLLPWRDVLHDGPVPKGLTLEELSAVRAEFIIGCGWGEPDRIKQGFIERDNILKSFRDYEKVILWFEHDLYDQLQILQILDWFYEQDGDDVALSIICRDQYLGLLSPDEMKGLLKYEEPVTEQHLVLAHKAWAAFRENSPEAWAQLLDEDTSVLPFLAGAIVRMLEEYPNDNNGLSRTAQQALGIIAEDEVSAAGVFGLNQQLEERIFLGDSGFWMILQEMIDASPALLTLSEGEVLTSATAREQLLSITTVGLEVVSGSRNWLDIKKQDRWIGGVRLEADNVWCWDSERRNLRCYVPQEVV